MSDEVVSVKRLARMIGLDRSSALKYLKRLGVRPEMRRTTDSANQLAATITSDEAECVLRMRREAGFVIGDGISPPPAADGYFYAIQLVPELEPGRIKLGFAGRVEERLQQHRTAAPTAIVLATWPCRRVWETAAMDAATQSGCQAVGTEVFDFGDIDDLLDNAGRFFEAMPSPFHAVPVSPHSLLATKKDETEPESDTESDAA